jgi:DNA-binding IclR family transcriptional regulator
MTDLNALLIFAKVVEAKSFSEAARRLGMPVSTVSRRVAELEDQLGARLLRVQSTIECLGHIAAFRTAQHFRHVGEPVDNRVPGELPQRPCAGYDC